MNAAKAWVAVAAPPGGGVGAAAGGGAVGARGVGGGAGGSRGLAPVIMPTMGRMSTEKSFSRKPLATYNAAGGRCALVAEQRPPRC